MRKSGSYNYRKICEDDRKVIMNKFQNLWHLLFFFFFKVRFVMMAVWICVKCKWCGTPCAKKMVKMIKYSEMLFSCFYSLHCFKTCYIFSLFSLNVVYFILFKCYFLVATEGLKSHTYFGNNSQTCSLWSLSV